MHLPPRLAALALLALAGCSRPAALATPPRETAGGLVVTLTSGPAMHTGDDTAAVTLADAATGAPVGNANITASPDMRAPAMKGVSVSGRAQGNGLYNIPVRLAVATRYRLSLHIERPGHAAADVAFPVEAFQ
jgi:hypothetical protein